jgi:hypothetical protein
MALLLSVDAAILRRRRGLDHPFFAVVLFCPIQDLAMPFGAMMTQLIWRTNATIPSR